MRSLFFLIVALLPLIAGAEETRITCVIHDVYDPPRFETVTKTFKADDPIGFENDEMLLAERGGITYFYHGDSDATSKSIVLRTRDSTGKKTKTSFYAFRNSMVEYFRQTTDAPPQDSDIAIECRSK